MNSFSGAKLGSCFRAQDRRLVVIVLVVGKSRDIIKFSNFPGNHFGNLKSYYPSMLTKSFLKNFRSFFGIIPEAPLLCFELKTL